MKRVLFSIFFGVIGVLVQWSLPILFGFLGSGDGVQHHSEDEAGRQLTVYFVIGGMLFFLLSAWMGWICATNWRKAIWMLVGSIVGSILIVVVPRLFTASMTGLDGWQYDLAFVIVWAATSAALAFLAGKYVASTPS